MIWGTILMGISFADSFELSLSIFTCIVLALATIKGVKILGGKKTVMMSFLILIAGIVGYMCDGLNAAEIAAGGIDSIILAVVVIFRNQLSTIVKTAGSKVVKWINAN